MEALILQLVHLPLSYLPDECMEGIWTWMRVLAVKRFTSMSFGT